MKYLTTRGYEISRLSLGTVALGLAYGVSNTRGKPGREEALSVLRTAVKAGINCLDTARSYGDAEQLIGDFLEENRGGPVHIVTKFKLQHHHLADARSAIGEAKRSLRESLDALRLKQVPVCLLHMDRGLPLARVVDLLPQIMESLKNDGLIDLGGISVDHPDEVGAVGLHPLVDVLQIPVSVMDQRLVRNGMMDRLAERAKIVFARSVFLQGLYFMDPRQLSGNLVEAMPYLVSLKAIAEREGLSVAETAFSYVYHMSGISGIVFGAERADQVTSTLALTDVPRLSDAARASIADEFNRVPEQLITPAYWKPQK